MVASYYFVVFVAMLCYLVTSVAMLRKSLNSSMGDANNPTLQRAIRAHANFIETVPFTFVLLIALELSGGLQVFLHSAYILFALGRVLHMYGIKYAELNANYTPRIIGTMIAQFTWVVSAVYLLVLRFV